MSQGHSLTQDSLIRVEYDTIAHQLLDRISISNSYIEKTKKYYKRCDTLLMTVRFSFHHKSYQPWIFPLQLLSD